jgi:hypothetical protein
MKDKSTTPKTKLAIACGARGQQVESEEKKRSERTGRPPQSHELRRMSALPTTMPIARLIMMLEALNKILITLYFLA